MNGQILRYAFGRVGLLTIVGTLAGTPGSYALPSGHAKEAQVILPFDGSVESRKWQIVNDGVMGGNSVSTAIFSRDNVLIFRGELSLENNGGFASTRSPAIKADMAGYRGVELTVVGDGKTYKCGLRTDDRFDGVTHQASFKTQAGEVQTVRIPYEDFNPTWRGRNLPEDRRMKPGSIRTIGFLIADKQAGPFRLEVRKIGAYRDATAKDPEMDTDVVSVATRAGSFNTLLAAIEAAGLTDALRAMNGITLFAPSDDAFKKLPEGTVAELLKPGNQDRLIEILTYHVLEAEVPFKVAVTLDEATALNGQTIDIAVQKGGLVLNDSRVVDNDITTRNGILHVIDAVLLPPESKAESSAPVDVIVRSAIARGVPLFNRGHHQACADLYELAAEALLTLPPDRLGEGERKVLSDALSTARGENSATSRAWVMRHALDLTMELTAL